MKTDGGLWGARAEFVASLGRKVEGAREALAVARTEPAAKPPRDELKRRLHTLGESARLLNFGAMAKGLREAEDILEAANTSGGLALRDVDALGALLDDLPALAWGDARKNSSMPRRSPAPPAAPARPSPSRVPPPDNSVATPNPTGGTKARGKPALAAREAMNRDEGSGPLLPPMTSMVVVLGDELLAHALAGSDGDMGERVFECERTDEAPRALAMARALAPDVVVVDVDREGGPGVVEALLDDPLTEPSPVVVVGTFEGESSASRFVALGVARALGKPVAPESLRRACAEAVDQREGRTVPMTLGEPTVEQLGERLADEVRRALVDAAEGRTVRVPLGQGGEVMGAVWGAIGRVRQVVTARTGGAVRFVAKGPEGAVGQTPWLHMELPAGSRGGLRGRGASTADVRLDGRRVVVADDDPGVTWFVADLLRAAGCEVHEAFDGKAALALCQRVQPELVVADVLMPGIDGVSLARFLRRDVVLRDTPVVLLSWKEDLLQRARELGAPAAAYLRKESDARAILARVREVLRPRARLEARVRGDGEVHGRLDGVTVATLLEIVARARRNARFSLRDATFLYEVELRDGAPRRIVRSAEGGDLTTGPPALASLLGVSAGRFVVATATSDDVRVGSGPDVLTGSLRAQLAMPIASARAALDLLTGPGLIEAYGVVLDEGAMGPYLTATPEPLARVLRKLAAGASPRQLLLGGTVAPSALEDALADVAVRGFVRGVTDGAGDDVLARAHEWALAAIEGRPPREPFPLSPSADPPQAAAARVPSAAPPAVVLTPPPPPRVATPAPPEASEEISIPVVLATPVAAVLVAASEPPTPAPTANTEPKGQAPAAAKPRLVRRIAAAILGAGAIVVGITFVLHGP